MEQFRKCARGVAFLFVLALGAAACGNDGDSGSGDEHHGPPHTLLRIGSSTPAAGKLDVEEVPVAFVEASACLGGTGDDCSGGVVVYSGSSPGFDDLDEDNPGRPLYILTEGIDVFVEITAIDPGASLLVSGVLLDEVGEMALVNESGHLHNHPAWQLAEAAGEHPADRQIRLRLHADGFEPSDEIAVTVSLYEGHGHDHGDSGTH